MEQVKVIADNAGLDFPDVGLAPPRSGVHVPRVVPDISEFLAMLPN